MMNKNVNFAMNNFAGFSLVGPINVESHFLLNGMKVKVQ